MKQQIKIIAFIVTLFLISSVFLFFINNKSLNSEAQKDYWTVAFDNPKDSSLDFIIENHSSKNNFHWEVSGDNAKLNSGDAVIIKRESKNVDLNVGNSDKKITITVSDGENKKEIYKNL